MLRRILLNLPSRRAQLVSILALTLLEALFASVSITMLIPLTQAVLGATSEGVWLLRYVPAALLERPDHLFLLFGSLLVLKVLVGTARQAWSAYLSEKLRTEWQTTLAERMIWQPYAALVQSRRGEMISDLTQQTAAGSTFVLRYLTYLANVIVLTFVICAMGLVQWRAMLVLALVAVAGWFTVGRPYYQWAQRLGRRAVAYNQMLASEIVETLAGIKEVKTSTSEPFRIGNIRRIARLSLVNKLWTRIAEAAPMNGAEALFGVGIIVTFAVVGSDRELNSILPLVVFFSAALLRTLSLSASVVSLRFAVVNQLPAFVNVTTRLLPGATASETANGGVPIKRIDTPIRFESVSFAYSTCSSEPAVQLLQELDFELPRGKVVCLFGPSGSGKTTIVDLIMRLFHAGKGRIAANGRDIREFELRAWRRVIGYVGQEPYLFNGTIEENIRLGEQTFGPGELRQAAARASALEFIEALPQGFATPVGDQGAALSGGQKRRIALARALVRCPSVLILDETTNALDEEMERQLIAMLRKQEDLTVLVVSHRDVSAQSADISYELHEGRLRQRARPSAFPSKQIPAGNLR